MEYYPDATENTMNDRLDVLVKMLDACSALSYAARFPMLEPDTHGYTVGRKYARVWRDCSNGQRFVDFFVDMTTGEVWKADGWKKPTLNFSRGTIMTPEGRYALTGAKVSDVGYFYSGL